MSRNLSTNTINATSALLVLPIVFVEVAFSSGYLSLHTGYGDLTFNGSTYTGAGGLLGISEVEEDTDTCSHGCRFSLNGLDAGMTAAFLQEQYQGRPVRAWLAFFNADGSQTLLADPYEFFTGRLDTASMSVDGDSAALEASAESELIDLRRSREQRYTHVNMTRLNPTDKGFEFVEGIQNRAILWGKVYREGEAGYWKRKGHWYMNDLPLALGGHGPTLVVFGGDTGRKMITLGKGPKS